MTMNLSPDKMIVVLTSGISFPFGLCDYALLMRRFDHRLSIKKDNGFSDLKLCMFALLFCLNVAM